LEIVIFDEIVLAVALHFHDLLQLSFLLTAPLLDFILEFFAEHDKWVFGTEKFFEAIIDFFEQFFQRF
jgi:hypothetical protein